MGYLLTDDCWEKIEILGHHERVVGKGFASQCPKVRMTRTEISGIELAFGLVVFEEAGGCSFVAVQNEVDQALTTFPRCELERCCFVFGARPTALGAEGHHGCRNEKGTRRYGYLGPGLGGEWCMPRTNAIGEEECNGTVHRDDRPDVALGVENLHEQRCD